MLSFSSLLDLMFSSTLYFKFLGWGGLGTDISDISIMCCNLVMVNGGRRCGEVFMGWLRNVHVGGM